MSEQPNYLISDCAGSLTAILRFHDPSPDDMNIGLRELIGNYDPDSPLAEASTPPSAWYTDPRILELEQRTVFSRSWQLTGRAEQVRNWAFVEQARRDMGNSA